MRNFIAGLTLAALPMLATAQTTAAKPASATGGTITIGVQQVDNNSNSSAFTEYRDLRDGRTPLAFTYRAKAGDGLYFSMAGADVTRRDQSLGVAAGKPGVWKLNATWDELPHNLSNTAKSPYTSSLPGVLEVPQTMAITFKKLATGSSDAASVVAMDAIAASYIQQYAKPVSLGMDLKNGGFALQVAPLKSVNLELGFSRREKSGSRIGYGPIGDRPPRTLNIQLPEPVDYTTSDFKAAAEIVTPRYQLRGEYLQSQFENGIDVLKWRNVWASAPAGATHDTWDRAVAVYGVRPLAPDNTYQSFMLTGGLALPFASRLTASVALGTMEQDGALLPYAYQNNLLVNKTLPRSTAEGKMATTALSAEYSITPLPQLSVRAFARHYELDNQTPSAQWQYVTQDASSLTGTVSYKNKRVSTAFAWDRQNLGIESTVRAPALKGSVVLAFEREDFGREHLEAEATTENIVRLAWSGRPAKWISARARVQRGVLDAGEYNWRASNRSYWYGAADLPDNDNPQFTFGSHPDLRLYTMADRVRDQADLSVTLTPQPTLSLSARFKTRVEDFESDVRPVQPLLGFTVADNQARTPGNQLGLLKREQQQLSFDVTYAPNDRLGVNASVGQDVGASDMRSLEYNENNKMNPSTVSTSELGPWTRATSQWTASFNDRSTYLMLGGTYEIVPNKVTLAANFSSARADLDIGYAGFGVTNFDGTPYPANHQFSFTSPPPVEQTTTVTDVSLAAPLFGRVQAHLGLRNERYTLDDWQQAAGTPQFEAVGSDLLLRDTSRSHQWGNRLLNLGSYLAPGYTATLVYVGLTYAFGGSK